MGESNGGASYDTWDINLRVGEVRMTLTIPRSPDEEQALRNAASQVNSTLEKYRMRYPSATKEQLMSYVALDIANKLQRLQLRDETLKLENRLEMLNRSIEEAL